MNQFGFVILVNLVSASLSSKHNDGLNFFVLGDWGGLPTYPYTTKIDVKNSRRSESTVRAGFR